MAGPKVKRRDLKEDKVYVTMAGIGEFFVRHRFKFALGALGLLVAFALAYYWNLRSERLASEASLALYKANKIEDQAGELEALAKVYQDYAGTPSAAMARYERANLLYEQGKYEEALKAFQEFVTRDPKHPAASAAMEAMGYCYESLDRWKEAANEYETLRKRYPSLPAAKRVTYRLGLCYEHLGEKDKAANAYRKTEELLPQSLWAEYAKEHLASLSPNGSQNQAAAVTPET